MINPQLPDFYYRFYSRLSKREKGGVYTLPKVYLGASDAE